MEMLVVRGLHEMHGIFIEFVDVTRTPVSKCETFTNRCDARE